MCRAVFQRDEITFKVGQIKLFILAAPFSRHVTLDKAGKRDSTCPTE